MATVDIKLPNIGDFSEVGVIEVLVAIGDHVKHEQSLITVESDKASMEIPSPAEGVIDQILVKLGDKVSEGSLIMRLNVASPTVSASAAQATATTTATTTAAATAQGSVPVSAQRPRHRSLAGK